IVGDWWAKDIGPKVPLPERTLFRRCLKFSSRDLILEFDGVTYLQAQGLAMGVASSPDLANIYAAHFEESIIPNLKELIFFGRFIDDVFGIVVADSEEQAIAITRTINYGPLQLTWDVSEWSLPFLDLLVFIDPTTNRIEHKPFRKARNHLERIP